MLFLFHFSGRQAEAYEELSKIAPTVYVGVDPTNYVASVEKNITLIGKIFGKEKEAASELATVKEKMTALKDSAPTDKKRFNHSNNWRQN